MKIWKFALLSNPFAQSIKDLDEELCLMTLKSDVKFEENLNHGSKNYMMNFVRFNASSGKLEKFHFDVLLLSIAYQVAAKNVKKNYLSQHWRKIQTLKKNWLFIWKMTWRIWTLTWAVESLKLCTLMDYFCRKYVMLELKRNREVVSWKMTYVLKIT